MTTEQLPAHGFRITNHRPTGLTPEHFYEAIVSLCGIRSQAPPPHEVEALQVESDGRTVHVELALSDGRLGVVDVELYRGIRGLL